MIFKNCTSWDRVIFAFLDYYFMNSLLNKTDYFVAYTVYFIFLTGYIFQCDSLT